MSAGFDLRNLDVDCGRATRKWWLWAEALLQIIASCVFSLIRELG